MKWLALPVQGAFFKRVEVGDGQDADKSSHAPNDHAVLFYQITELNSPRIHEDNLDIENDEEHRDEVEFYAKSRSSLSDGEHSAFVWSFLDFRVTAFFSKENTETESNASEANRCDGLEDNWKVIEKHGGVKRNCPRRRTRAIKSFVAGLTSTNFTTFELCVLLS